MSTWSLVCDDTKQSLWVGQHTSLYRDVHDDLEAFLYQNRGKNLRYIADCDECPDYIEVGCTGGPWEVYACSNVAGQLVKCHLGQYPGSRREALAAAAKARYPLNRYWPTPNILEGDHQLEVAEFLP